MLLVLREILKDVDDVNLTSTWLDRGLYIFFYFYLLTFFNQLKKTEINFITKQKLLSGNWATEEHEIFYFYERGNTVSGEWAA